MSMAEYKQTLSLKRKKCIIFLIVKETIFAYLLNGLLWIMDSMHSDWIEKKICNIFVCQFL